MRGRPIPGDPSADIVQSVFDVRSQEWWIGLPGEVSTYAVETMRDDGTDWQRAIAVEIPVRRNHGKSHRQFRFMLSPEAALQLATNLAHTGSWLARLDDEESA